MSPFIQPVSRSTLSFSLHALSQFLISLTQNIAATPHPQQRASTVYVLFPKPIFYISIQLFSNKEIHHVSSLLRNLQWFTIANF